MRLREGLPTVPPFEEWRYVVAAEDGGGDAGGGGGGDTPTAAGGDAHLHAPLSAAEILHVARRVSDANWRHSNKKGRGV
eukprot:2420884-Pyramimonas_sp.AAC.1